MGYLTTVFAGVNRMKTIRFLPDLQVHAFEACASNYLLRTSIQGKKISPVEFN